MTDLSQRSNAQLFEQFTAAMRELRARDVLRTNNPPAGDYAEWLAQRALGGVLAPPAEKSYDFTMDDGTLVQVKARTVSPRVRPGQLETSVFRSWDFDQAVFVQFAEADYQVVKAWLVPMQRVKESASWSDHVSGWRVFMKPALMTGPGSIDITDRLIIAAQATSADIGMRRRPREAEPLEQSDQPVKFIVSTQGGDSDVLPKRHAMLALVTALSGEMSCSEIQGLLTPSTFVRVDEALEGGALWAAMSDQLGLGEDKRKLWFVDAPIIQDGVTWVLAANVWGRNTESRMQKLVRAGSGLISVRRVEDGQVA